VIFTRRPGASRPWSRPYLEKGPSHKVVGRPRGDSTASITMGDCISLSRPTASGPHANVGLCFGCHCITRLSSLVAGAYASMGRHDVQPVGAGVQMYEMTGASFYYLHWVLRMSPACIYVQRLPFCVCTKRRQRVPSCRYDQGRLYYTSRVKAGPVQSELTDKINRAAYWPRPFFQKIKMTVQGSVTAPGAEDMALKTPEY
jgi:hypothetical protein